MARQYRSMRCGSTAVKERHPAQASRPGGGPRARTNVSGHLGADCRRVRLDGPENGVRVRVTQTAPQSNVASASGEGCDVGSTGGLRSGAGPRSPTGSSAGLPGGPSAASSPRASPGSPSMAAAGSPTAAAPVSCSARPVCVSARSVTAGAIPRRFTSTDRPRVPPPERSSAGHRDLHPQASTETLRTVHHLSRLGMTPLWKASRARTRKREIRPSRRC
jgi:hypothetical protein